MESLSGPLHSRNLSNGNGFSSKNAYDGVLFSGGQRKFGTPTFSAARAQDYREIFGSSTHGVSSIPVLDLSDFDDSSSNVRSSEPDYFKIFSGFKDDDVAVSHEELFGGVKGVRTSPEKKIRTPPATRQPSQDSGDLFDKSNQPVDAIKQFNMSYHKTTQRSNDGSNGTTHVAQLRDVPGFTCFIDEIKMAPEQKTETQSRKGSATNIVSPNVDFNEGIYEVKNSKKSMLDMGNERTSGNTVKSKIKYSRAGSFFDEKLFNVHEINLGSHPSKLPPPSRDATSLDGHQTPSNGPTASKSRESKTKVQERSRGDLSPPSDEELDINSAAAASAAALRKAIEKAQESIRIAKESVGRKKAGLQSFSNRSFKDSPKVKGIIDNVEACEKVGAGSEGFAQMERKDAFRDGAVYPGFKNGEKLFVARKVIGELHEKISESARKSEMSNWYAPELKQSDNVPMAKEVSGEMNGKNLDSAEKCKAATWVSDRANMEMGKADGLAFEQADSENVFLESADKFESKAKEIRTTNVTLKEKFVKKAEAGEKACELEGMKRKQNVVEDRLESSCADDKKENGIAGSEQEEETNREEPRGFFKLVNFVKNLRGFGDKTEEDQRVFDKLKTNDYEVRLNGSHELMHGNELKDFEEMMGSDQKEPQESQQQQKTFEEECEGDAENETGLGMNCNHNLADQVLEELSQWVETGPKEADASEERKQEDFHQVEAVEKWLDEVQELAINDKTPTYAHDFDESDDRMLNEFKVERSDAQEGENIEKRSEGSDANVEKESKEALKQKCGREEENHDKVAEDYMYEERESILVEARESIPSKAGGNQENGKVEIPQEVSCEEFLNRDCDNLSHDASSIAAESQDSCKIEIEINDNSCTPGVTEVFCEFKDEKAETIEVTNKVQEKEILAAANEIAAEDKEIEFEVIEVHEDFSPYHNVVESNVADTEVRENEIGQSDEQSDSADGIDTVSNESTQIEEIINQEKTAFSEEQVKHTPERADIHEEAKTLEIKDELQRSQYRERKEDSHNKTTDGWKAKENEDSLYKTTDGWKAKENEPRKEEEKKHLKEVDEATKRQWEREKDKIAVERAIREVRERAFAEARERAERAAVEKATAEARQRVMAEAREKIGKVAAAAKSSSEKASVEAKLRAERAAVERATAEARERALEKAMSQKMTSSRSESELFSGASRDHGNRQSSSSSDLHGSNGTNVESAQRSKARLETHNRIMERAAKALAEKEKRDHLAQKEQAERNRLAETLDADIKRWSSGKEGNLRALLSTLQCILGTESGWQPVSLTEIITTSAVKKAYRKATLCVHPDKLQQRGASIQQKYICEKVFDLLKAAWNRFHSEER